MKRILSFALLATIAPAFAQEAWDTTGNGLLNGRYYFREVLVVNDAARPGNLNRALVQYGNITFDGNGNYTVSGTLLNSSFGQPAGLLFSGTYAIGASGHGFLRRIAAAGGFLYGGIAQGVLIASATENGFHSLFVAVPASDNPPTLTDKYSVVYGDLVGTNLSQVRDAQFEFAPTGSGGLAAINATGYVGTNLNVQAQTINGASYTFAGGLGTLTLAAAPATALLSGPKEFVVSPNGNIIFGGSRNGYDFFIGVKTPPGTVASSVLNGTYLQAGLEVYRAGGPPEIDSYWGAMTNNSGTLIGHQRLLVPPNTSGYDFLYNTTYTLSSAGTYTDNVDYRFQASADGTLQIAHGTGNFVGIAVAVKLPSFSGQGPYINPTAMLNAASYVPFTSSIAPGTVVTLFGTGFADQLSVDGTFPLTLGGVSVLVNGSPAPVYVVSPNQISFVMPYSVTGIVGVQVRRNGVTGNRVTAFVGFTSPGIFTIPANGVGLAAALHADFTLVTEQNPARPGEVIQVYLTGLGAVDPTVTAGTPGPVSPLSKTTQDLVIYVGGEIAEVFYSGLAPQLGGLYQINIRVPPNTIAGTPYIEISGPGSFARQARIPVQ